jgi:thiol-disulfide isomerase/thioredoxin
MWYRNFSRLISLWVLVAALSGLAHAAIAPGDPVPSLSEYQLSGDTPALEGKVVVIDFWASWCAPCKQSFPALGALQTDFAAQGLVVVGVSVDGREADYLKFIKRMNPEFSTLHDSKQQLAAAMSPPAMPTSYIFGRDGRLRTIHIGFHGDRTVTELKAEITALLQEKQP